MPFSDISIHESELPYLSGVEYHSQNIKRDRAVTFRRARAMTFDHKYPGLTHLVRWLPVKQQILSGQPAS